MGNSNGGNDRESTPLRSLNWEEGRIGSFWTGYGAEGVHLFTIGLHPDRNKEKWLLTTKLPGEKEHWTAPRAVPEAVEALKSKAEEILRDWVGRVSAPATPSGEK